MSKNKNLIEDKFHTKTDKPTYTGKDLSSKFTINHIIYNQDNFKYHDLSQELSELNIENDYINWIDIVGLKDLDSIKKVCSFFNIHPLTIEDIINRDHQAKFEEYKDYIFVINKDLFISEDNEIFQEQISFILFDNLLISFRENDSPIFDNVFNRIRYNTNIRKFSSDYLLYALIDSIVDKYFLLLEELSNQIDILEDNLLENPSKDLLDNIYILKRDLTHIRNTLWHMRNTVSNLIASNSSLIKSDTKYYFRDISDHIIQIIDLTEISREVCSGMLDTYLSSIGNQTNDIMRILTIVSTISIPMTFLTGLYGMNFKYFPILDWKYALPSFWILNIIIIILMVTFFKKKKWI